MEIEKRNRVGGKMGHGKLKKFFFILEKNYYSNPGLIVQ